MESFPTRNEMILKVNKHAIIAEIGVFRGDFSVVLDKTLEPKELHLIDIWADYTYSGDQDGNNETYCDLPKRYLELKEKYEGTNVTLHRDYSYNVLTKFDDDYFDMIYIDGDHSYEGCKRDLELCYKKIKHNGWIMGHDYEMNMKKAKKELHFGVKRAVDEFCKEYNQIIKCKGMDGCVSYGIRLDKKQIVYHGKHRHWHDDVIFSSNQTYRKRGNPQEEGVYFYHDKVLYLRWYNYDTEEMYTNDNGLTFNNKNKDYPLLLTAKYMRYSIIGSLSGPFVRENGQKDKNESLAQERTEMEHALKGPQFESNMFIINSKGDDWKIPTSLLQFKFNIINNYSSEVGHLGTAINYLHLIKYGLEKDLHPLIIFDNMKCTLNKDFVINVITGTKGKTVDQFAPGVTIFYKQSYHRMLKYISEKSNVTLDEYIYNNFSIDKPIIGIYSIFIGKYAVFYDNFIKNMEKCFLPAYNKKYYIVTDANLKKHTEDTYFVQQKFIGWPYETLYRFHYFLRFNKSDYSDVDYMYFFNSNSLCCQTIGDEILPTEGFVFTKHNHQGHIGYEATFEKDKKDSTAYIPFEEDKKYTYIGGRFFGGKLPNFIELCNKLKENIEIDEKKNIIALWHDESHLNWYYHCYLNCKKSKILSDDYHVPEECINAHPNRKIYYIDKNKFEINKNASHHSGTVIDNSETFKLRELH